MTFKWCPIIIVLWVRPWVMTYWKPCIILLSVSKTFSSRSRGSSVVLVRNLSLSARLVRRNWKPCIHSKATLAACHSTGASCISDSFMVCTTLLMVGVPRMTGILAENPLGFIQNKDDLLFILVGHSLYLDPHQGGARGLHSTTAQPY